MKHTLSRSISKRTFLLDKLTGFTLIEMLIVVAIIGILAAVAVPAYLDQVRKGRRAEARSALLTTMQQQERLYTQTNSFKKFTNSATAVPGFTTYSGDQGALGAKYWIKAEDCAPVDSTCIRLTAVPANSWSDPTIGEISLTSAGTKACSGTSGSDKRLCWP
jgi:type IV pilus assembly protein PilE